MKPFKDCPICKGTGLLNEHMCNACIARGYPRLVDDQVASARDVVNAARAFVSVDPVLTWGSDIELLATLRMAVDAYESDDVSRSEVVADPLVVDVLRAKEEFDRCRKEAQPDQVAQAIAWLHRFGDELSEHTYQELASILEAPPRPGRRRLEASPRVHPAGCGCVACLAPVIDALAADERIDEGDREHIEGLFEEHTNDASSPKYRGLIEDVIEYVRQVRAERRRPDAQRPTGRHGWTIRYGATVVECPGCAFAFDISHETEGPDRTFYDCPNCGDSASAGHGRSEAQAHTINGVATSCENAERHIARLAEYLGEANDEATRLRGWLEKVRDLLREAGDKTLANIVDEAALGSAAAKSGGEHG